MKVLLIDLEVLSYEIFKRIHGVAPKDESGTAQCQKNNLIVGNTFFAQTAFCASEPAAGAKTSLIVGRPFKNYQNRTRRTHLTFGTNRISISSLPSPAHA